MAINNLELKEKQIDKIEKKTIIFSKNKKMNLQKFIKNKKIKQCNDLISVFGVFII